ncbi:MAG: ROK family protein [Bryobacteraceae bacterium]|nr:ROK family protein [Bryobacteraceae bacterium]MDW8380179.1 ROK family protein [Bryobacterales bacterium]
MADYAIGVDLGGTNLRAAAITASGTMLEKVGAPTDLSTAETVIRDIVRAIESVRAKLREHRLVGVGIGVPGFIRIAEGLVVGSNNLVCLEGYPVRDRIEQALGAPVILENDANAAALGEKWMGAGRDVEDLVLLTLGTGIGGGIISKGRVLHGFVGMAGELGHLTVAPNGNPCGCGNTGCLEKHASATAIESMAKLLALGDDLTAKDVYDLAVAGNERARRVFESMGQALGVAIAMLINVFNFPLYLMSGGVLAAWDYFYPSLEAEVRRRSYTYRHTETRIEKARLGNEAGIYGAAYLPFQAQQAIFAS